MKRRVARKRDYFYCACGVAITTFISCFLNDTYGVAAAMAFLGTLAGFVFLAIPVKPKNVGSPKPLQRGRILYFRPLSRSRRER